MNGNLLYAQSGGVTAVINASAAGVITAARRVLGFQPQVSLETGLADLASWLDGQQAPDRVLESRAELAQRGLML